MSVEDYRAEARDLLARMLMDPAIQSDREQALDGYADELGRMYVEHTHSLLTEVIDDVRTRLDARLSPDPVRQTIASVQTTVQDLWKNIWG